jgi:hypothetical protein
MNNFQLNNIINENIQPISLLYSKNNIFLSLKNHVIKIYEIKIINNNNNNKLTKFNLVTAIQENSENIFLYELPNKNIIYYSIDGFLKIRNKNNFISITTFSIHIERLKIYKNGNLLTLFNNQIKIWKIDGLRFIHLKKFIFKNYLIYNIFALKNEYEFIFSSFDYNSNEKGITIFKNKKEKNFIFIEKLNNNNQIINQNNFCTNLIFINNNNNFIVNDYNKIYLINNNNNNEKNKYKIEKIFHFEENINIILKLNDNNFIISFDSINNIVKKISKWKINNKENIIKLDEKLAHFSIINNLTLLNNNFFISMSKDKTIKIWRYN